VSAYLVVVGLGLGLVLQVPVLAIQNAVPVRYLGAATSASLLFRSIGGALGVAVFGGLLNARMEAALGYVLPTEALLGGQLSVLSTEAGRIALSEAITGIFGVAVPVILVAFGCAWLLPEIPLRTTTRVPT
jgi:hypothetical protein